MAAMLEECYRNPPRQDFQCGQVVHVYIKLVHIAHNAYHIENTMWSSYFPMLFCSVARMRNPIT